MCKGITMGLKTNHRCSGSTARRRATGRLFLGLLAVALLAYGQPAQADVVGEGDITPSTIVTDWKGRTITIPDLPYGGNDPSDPNSIAPFPLVVGGTGEQVSGTEFGLLTINNPTFTDPLYVTAATIGYEQTGAGQVIITGFTSELVIQGEFDDPNSSSGTADGDFVVGWGGYGELNIENGALVEVLEEIDPNDPNTSTGIYGNIVIGKDFTSEGLITIDGFTSSFVAPTVIIGEYGTGDYVATDRANIRTVNVTVGQHSGSRGSIRLSDLGTRWINQGSVTLGDEGHAVLEINDEADAIFGVLDDDPVNATKFVSGNTNVGELGTIALGGGRLLTYNLDNFGVIRGDGTLQATNSFVIEPGAELRNAASTANLRERIYVADPNTTVENNGLITSVGGEMEFEGPVENNLNLVARDAIMRFNDPNDSLTNNGDIVLGGDTTLYAESAISSPGNLSVLSDSTAAIVGDLTFTGASVLTLTVGDTPGTLDVIGTADLGGALLLLDYAAGGSAQSGDSYQVFQATGGLGGSMFSNATLIADGLIWNIGYSATTVMVTAATPAIPFGSDFNGDGIVDRQDLLIWQAFFPMASGADPSMGDADGDGDVDGADFLEWQHHVGGAPAVPAGGAVPEPSGLALLLIGATISLGRRGRRNR